MVYRLGTKALTKNKLRWSSEKRCSTWFPKVDGLIRSVTSCMFMTSRVQLLAGRQQDYSVCNPVGGTQRTRVLMDHHSQHQVQHHRHSQELAVKLTVTVSNSSTKQFYSTMDSSQAGSAHTCQIRNRVPVTCSAKSSKIWSQAQPTLYQNRSSPVSTLLKFHTELMLRNLNYDINRYHLKTMQ